MAKPAEIKPAPREQPFSKLSTPPTEEFRDYELPPFELLHYEEKPEGPTEEDKDEMLEIQQKIIDTLDDVPRGRDAGGHYPRPDHHPL